MNSENTPLEIFEKWFDKLETYRDEMPAKGSVAGALVVIERLREHYDLSLEAHLTRGGGQISGAGGGALERILNRYGEQRRFLSEGGRTNRGLLGDITSMLQYLESMELDVLDKVERNVVLDELQQFLVAQVQKYHNLSRIEFDYDLHQSTWHLIHGLLEKAIKEGKGGPVAQHLVGAKLQLRFPEYSVRNESFSTADVQLDRPGDFTVKETVFHVTIAPQPAVYQKCIWNLSHGLRPYLIVPERLYAGTRQNADLASPGRISVGSIESFVSQNIDEISHFSNDELSTGLYNVLQTYNKRVEEAEIDKSIMIEIPAGLMNE